MAIIAACTRESRCTTSRIHQHIRKNSVLLKEVLTHRCQSAPRALVDNTTNHSHDDTNSALKSDTGDCQHHRKCLCCRGFRYSRIARSACSRCHCQPSIPDESALRGL